LSAQDSWLLSGGNGPSDVNQPVWGNRATVGQELARVVEEDDAVAQQAPPLLGMEGDDAGRVTVRAVSWRTQIHIPTIGPFGPGVTGQMSRMSRDHLNQAQPLPGP
jgi:hypothetical protein